MRLFVLNLRAVLIVSCQWLVAKGIAGSSNAYSQLTTHHSQISDILSDKTLVNGIGSPQLSSKNYKVNYCKNNCQIKKRSVGIKTYRILK